MLEEATTVVGKSNYDAGIEYLDRNYGSIFDGKASNGDSLKNISGIMGKFNGLSINYTIK